MMALINGEPVRNCGRMKLHSSQVFCHVCCRHTEHIDGVTVGVVTVKQHPLIVMVVVLICDLLLPVGVTFPQLLVYHLLNLCDTVRYISNRIQGVVFVLHHKLMTPPKLLQY